MRLSDSNSKIPLRTDPRGNVKFDDLGLRQELKYQQR